MHRTFKLAAAGLAIWLVYIFWFRPHPFDSGYAVALLLLGPLVLVPLGLRLALSGKSSLLVRAIHCLQLPAALVLVLSFFWPPSILAGVLSLPWFAVTVLIAIYGIFQIVKDRIGAVPQFAMNAGLVYLAIGGMWTVLARLGQRPLDFEPVIVLLTAIHFHHAGFVLPILAACAAKFVTGLLARLTCLGVIVSVPLVAAGITTTQLGYWPLLECVAAWIMALSGLLVGGLHLRLALQKKWPAGIRLFWSVAGVSLTFGMVLATMYGSRAFVEMSWLDIPWMRALHGSANALGFGLGGMAAWSWVFPLSDEG